MANFALIFVFCGLLISQSFAPAPACGGTGGVYSGSLNRCVYWATTPGDGCDTTCSDNSMTCADSDQQVIGYDGSNVHLTECQDASALFGPSTTASDGGGFTAIGGGCMSSFAGLYVNSDAPTTCAATTSSSFQRLCSCDFPVTTTPAPTTPAPTTPNPTTPNPTTPAATTPAPTTPAPTTQSSSGGQDPHFHGLNGENVDIIRDEKAANKIFSVFCDHSMIVNSKFSRNPEGLLFMTEFYGKIGKATFSLKLGKLPQIYGDYYAEQIKGERNATRFILENGFIESDGSETIMKLDHVQVNINTASDVDGNVYFDIDIVPKGEKPKDGRKAGGIIGRTFERKYSNEEFAQYLHFMVDSDPFNTCGGDKRFSR